MRTRRPFAIAVVVAVASLSACSGGSKHASTSTSTVTSTTSTSTSTSTPAPSTTAPHSTTSTTPVPEGAAASATFISSTHAWVLEDSHANCDSTPPPCTHRVFTTVDGGATWKPLGSIADPTETPTIRFADAEHGFAFDPDHLFRTVDGGASWSPLEAPFSGVQALAIARGVVYVVGYSTLLPSNFYVWSTPVSQLTWTRDPLALQLGAGPVPVEDLEFSGSNGYLVNNDRTVIGGARRAGSTGWTTWKPPCLTTGGPEQLAVSSATSLVALCEEGVYTGPKITNGAYFSTDGGATFHRKTAPASGSIGSPNASTAVIAVGDTIWRTTDSGTSWHVAYGPAATTSTNGAVAELGFTTPTQGYAILAGNRLVLTRDAGATWSAWGP